MKDLRDIVALNEGILDDEEDILGVVDDKLDLRAQFDYLVELFGPSPRAAYWIKREWEKIASGESILWDEEKQVWQIRKFLQAGGHRGSSSSIYDIVITDERGRKSAEPPMPIKINAFVVKYINYKGKTMLKNLIIDQAENVFFRDCPNLETLEGCPDRVIRFAVNNCPKLTSLQYAPKQADYFKVYNCGKKFTRKEIQKISKVPTKNIVYDS